MEKIILIITDYFNNKLSLSDLQIHNHNSEKTLSPNYIQYDVIVIAIVYLGKILICRTLYHRWQWRQHFVVKHFISGD